MGFDFKELWNVKQDGKNDDKHLVEFDVFICEDRCFFKLTIKTNSDVSLEAIKRKIAIYFSAIYLKCRC